MSKTLSIVLVSLVAGILAAVTWGEVIHPAILTHQLRSAMSSVDVDTRDVVCQNASSYDVETVRQHCLNK
jgi:hypothetical protein